MSNEGEWSRLLKISQDLKPIRPHHIVTLLWDFMSLLFIAH